MMPGEHRPLADGAEAFDDAEAARADAPVLPAPASPAEAAEEVADKVQDVTRAEVEDFLAQAVRLFLKGDLHVRLGEPGLPEVEIKLTDHELILNVRRLDDAVRWTAASGPSDVGPPEGEPQQVLDRFRVYLFVEDEPVVAFGRGIAGVQARTGRASFLLLKDFLKGVLGDKSAQEREKRDRARRERLEREIAHSRDRADATVVDTDPARVTRPETGPAGPSFGRERDAMRGRWR